MSSSWKECEHKCAVRAEAFIAPGLFDRAQHRIWPSVVFMSIVGSGEGFRILVLMILILCDRNFRILNPRTFIFGDFRSVAFGLCLETVLADEAGQASLLQITLSIATRSGWHMADDSPRPGNDLCHQATSFF